MSIAIINKSVPCVVADMIRDAIIFYKKKDLLVDTVYLPTMRFEVFKAWMLRQDDSQEIQDELHFKDIKIKKSRLLTEPMKITFKKQIGTA